MDGGRQGRWHPGLVGNFPKPLSPHRKEPGFWLLNTENAVMRYFASRLSNMKTSPAVRVF